MQPGTLASHVSARHNASISICRTYGLNDAAMNGHAHFLIARSWATITHRPVPVTGRDRGTQEAQRTATVVLRRYEDDAGTGAHRLTRPARAATVRAMPRKMRRWMGKRAYQ